MASSMWLTAEMEFMEVVYSNFIHQNTNRLWNWWIHKYSFLQLKNAVFQSMDLLDLDSCCCISLIQKDTDLLYMNIWCTVVWVATVGGRPQLQFSNKIDKNQIMNPWTFISQQRASVVSLHIFSGVLLSQTACPLAQVLM